MGWIEVQRGRQPESRDKETWNLEVKGMMAWGSIANSAPYKLEPKVVVVGRSKLLNNCFFVFSVRFGLICLFIGFVCIRGRTRLQGQQGRWGKENT